MASPPASRSASGPGSGDMQPTVTLDILSPSLGVPSPLILPDLPTSTTIGQVQDLIRLRLDVLDPSAIQIRTIYQGRILANETTLEAVFGAEIVRGNNHHVLHAVIPNLPAPPPRVNTQQMGSDSRHIIAQNQRERAAQNLHGIQDQPAARTGLPDGPSAATTHTPGAHTSQQGDTSQSTSSESQTQGQANTPHPVAVPFAIPSTFARQQGEMWQFDAQLNLLRQYVQAQDPTRPMPSQHQSLQPDPAMFLITSPEGQFGYAVNAPPAAALTQMTQVAMQAYEGGDRDRAFHGERPHDEIPLARQWALFGEPGPIPARRRQHRRPQPQGPQVRHRRIVIHRPNRRGAVQQLAALWPHVWLLVRLWLILWWFSNPNWSWMRWLGFVAILFTVLIVNLGVANGLVEMVWQPIRQHLDRLLHHGNPARINNPDGNGPNGAIGGAAQEQAPLLGNNAPVANPAGRQAEPDPHQAAARMVAAHRDANANWLLNQVRRVERAGLLFLASIAPGVAERHIEHIEAEARAERQRQEAAEAVAQAAAEAEQAARDAAATSESDQAKQQSLETGEQSVEPVGEPSGAASSASGGQGQTAES